MYIPGLKRMFLSNLTTEYYPHYIPVVPFKGKLLIFTKNVSKYNILLFLFGNLNNLEIVLLTLFQPRKSEETKH